MADADPFAYSDGDTDTNLSANPTLESLVEQRFSRRQTLFSGLTASSLAFMPAMLAGCGDDSAGAAPGVSGTASGQTSSGAVVSLMGMVTGNFSSFSWTQVSGPAVTIEDGNTQNARFLAPSVAAQTAAVFRLTASNSNGRSSTADVTVQIDPARLGFTAVGKNLNDIVTVPAGYNVIVLYRLGDPPPAPMPTTAPTPISPRARAITMTACIISACRRPATRPIRPTAAAVCSS